jgi:hypothetical protein
MIPVAVATRDTLKRRLGDAQAFRATSATLYFLPKTWWAKGEEACCRNQIHVQVDKLLNRTAPGKTGTCEATA